MRKTSLEMVYELARKDDRIVFIGSDLGKDTLNNFKKEMPDRFFMEGVSEANIVSMAAGLALEGKIPYINTIATFLTRRCFEQVVLDLALHQTRVRLISSGGGVVYAPLGPTHLAIEDLSILRPIPNMTIVSPADADEMRLLMPQTVEVDGPVYIRLAKGGDPRIVQDLLSQTGEQYKLGRAYQFKPGKDAVIFSVGAMLKAAIDAAAMLEARGIQAAVVHVPTLKPLDTPTILGCADRKGCIVTVEENVITGGLGSAVAELLAENISRFREVQAFKRLGLPDRFPHEYGSQSSQLKSYGLTAERIALTIEESLHGLS